MKRQSRWPFLSRAVILSISTAPAILGAQSSFDVMSGFSGMLDNYLSTVAQQELQKRDALIASLKTPAQVKARQEYIRRKLLEEIGGFPERTPLHPKISGTLDHPDYKVEKLIYESIPHFYVTASVYVPKNGQPPYPAVVGVAGHSGDGKAYDHYQPVWVSLAKRGMLVLAIDPPGQGERFEGRAFLTFRFRWVTGTTRWYHTLHLQSTSILLAFCKLPWLT